MYNRNWWHGILCLRSSDLPTMRCAMRQSLKGLVHELEIALFQIFSFIFLNKVLQLVRSVTTKILTAGTLQKMLIYVQNDVLKSSFYFALGTRFKWFCAYINAWLTGVGSNPTRGINFFLRFLYFCVQFRYQIV